MAKSILDQGKDLVGKAKRETAENVLSQSLNLLSHAPEKEYVRFANAVERLTGDDDSASQNQTSTWLKDWITQGSGTEYLKRVLTQMNPKMRKNFVAKLMVGMFFRPQEIYDRVHDETGVAPPVTLLISPTMRCNYRCTGCYAGSYTKDDDLPGELFDRVITEAKETLGMRFFTISGGEPFIYPPLLETFRKHNDCAFQVFTNSSLLTEEVCDTLAKLGNVAPCISIEGDEKATDERRGPGAYRRNMLAFDRLKQRGIVFAFSSTATRQNIDQITDPAFLDLMVEKGAYYGWYFAYIPIGKNPNLDYMPTPEQRNQLRLAVSKYRQTKPILLADFWNDAPFVGGCISAGRHFFHVNNKGDLEPCVFCHYATHNLKDTTLVEAIKSPFFSAIRSKQPFNHNLLRPCPLIDNPEIIRWAIEKCGAHPTHEGAESLVSNLADGLDRYSANIAKLYDPIWHEDYAPWAEEWGEKLWGPCFHQLGYAGDPEAIDMSRRTS